MSKTLTVAQLQARKIKCDTEGLCFVTLKPLTSSFEQMEHHDLKDVVNINVEVVKF